MQSLPIKILSIATILGLIIFLLWQSNIFKKLPLAQNNPEVNQNIGSTAENGAESFIENLRKREFKGGEIKIGEHTVDTLLVLKVEDDENLMRGGGSNFLMGEQESRAAEEGSYQISQGFLEESNSNPILEMESMISINKEYETAQKVIAALDSSLGHANEIGKV